MKECRSCCSTTCESEEVSHTIVREGSGKLKLTLTGTDKFRTDQYVQYVAITTPCDGSEFSDDDLCGINYTWTLVYGTETVTAGRAEGNLYIFDISTLEARPNEYTLKVATTQQGETISASTSFTVLGSEDLCTIPADGPEGINFKIPDDSCGR